MATHELLTPSQRDELSRFPAMGERDIARYYTLSDDDLNLIQARRGDHNRLGFALQLALLRFPGRAWEIKDSIPPMVLHYLAEQLGLAESELEGYASERSNTRREHLREIAQHFSYRNFSECKTELAKVLYPIVQSTDNGVVLVRALLDTMREKKIIAPALSSSETFAWEVRQRVRQDVEKQLIASLSERQKRDLDTLLIAEKEGGLTPLSVLRQAASRPSPKSFLKLLDNLDTLRDLGLDSSVSKTIHQNRLSQLVREGGKATPHNLKRLQPSTRYAMLVAYVLDVTARISDELLDMHDRILGTLFKRSEHQRDEAFTKQGKSINEKVQLYITLGKALIQAREEGNDAFGVIDSVLGWDAFVETVEEAEKLAQPLDFDYLMFAVTRFSWLRNYTPKLLAAFEFKAAPSAQTLVTAIELLKTLNQEERRKVPKDAPIGFVKQRWQPYVIQNGEIDRRYYELCVLNELRGHLRSGDIWISNSKRYQDFDDYLLSKESWQRLKQEGIPIAISNNVETYLEERSALLDTTLQTVEKALKKNSLTDVTLKNDRLVVSPLQGAIPEGVRSLRQQLYRMLPRIRLTELLVEVDSWTGFTRHFTHLQSDEPCEDSTLLLSALLADGINLGLEKMAQACPGLNYHQLAWVADWHVRDETYRRALAELVNAHHRLDFAKYWGDGTTSSSDGQFFQAGGQREAQAQTNARYGNEPGVTFYTHLSDQYIPFHTKVIAATSRDATYILDGLLYHETNLAIEEHYTDTHGYTDQIFAMCHLLGFRFAPRIRDVADKKLFSIKKPNTYPGLQPLLAEKIGLKHIKAYWDDILRLASSIKQGTVTASLILRKLASYPRRNGLALALRELGRIEKTLFLLDWYQLPELRQRVTHGLNKGELRNALAKAVFFHRLGEVRDRSFEDQMHRASGLNFLIAAIILWNTVYLEKAVETLRAKGMIISDEQLKHLAPIGWQHINLTGDYSWDFSQKSSLDKLRPLNVSSLLLP
jgi:TnpA family transposase